MEPSKNLLKLYKKYKAKNASYHVEEDSQAQI